LDKVGSQKPSDVNKFSVSASVGGGSLEVNETYEKFALGEFKALDKSTRLSSPAFENIEGGVNIDVEGESRKTSMATKRIIRYETIIIDNLFKGTVIKFYAILQLVFTGITNTMFAHFLKGNAVAKSSVSQATRKKLKPNTDAIKIEQIGYTVASMVDNSPVVVDEEVKQFTSFIQAYEYLETVKNTGSKEAPEMHVIPNTEVNAA
jgi:hypothetical protein